MNRSIFFFCIPLIKACIFGLKLFAFSWETRDTTYRGFYENKENNGYAVATPPLPLLQTDMTT
jgi:hypothetical protein